MSEMKIFFTYFCGFGRFFFLNCFSFECFSRHCNLRAIYKTYLGIGFQMFNYLILDLNDAVNDEEILETCENCNVTIPKSLILRHIGHVKYKVLG